MIRWLVTRWWLWVFLFWFLFGLAVLSPAPYRAETCCEATGQLP